VALQAGIPDTVGWVPMSNTYGAVYELSKLAPPPFDLRITDAGDQVLIARYRLIDLSNITGIRILGVAAK
jgi:hypothetical protein